MNEIEEMKKDISEIKSALIGNDYNSEHSIINRLKEVEKTANKLNLFRVKLVAFALGISFIVSLLSNILIEIYKQKN